MKTYNAETRQTANDAYFALSSLEEGDALYIHIDGKVEIGRDGCQPSNTLCLTTFATDDYLTRDEIESRYADWLAER